MTTPNARPTPGRNKASARTAIAWGVVVGVVQAATPLAFWWLDPATVYALGLAVIAAIYIGSLVWEVPLLTCGRSVQESSFRVVREF